MLSKNITYTDWNGTERTETFYFNLSRSEVIDMEVRFEGGLTGYLTKISESNDNNLIMDAFGDIVKRAYGVKSDDGRRFIKSDREFELFKQTAAYDELMVEFFSTEGFAAEFIRGIVPAQPQDRQRAQTTLPTPTPGAQKNVFEEATVADGSTDEYQQFLDWKRRSEDARQTLGQPTGEQESGYINPNQQ